MIRREITLIKSMTYNNYIYAYIFILPFSYFGSQMGLFTGILFILWLFFLKKNKTLVFSRLKELCVLKSSLFMIIFLFYVCLNYFWSDNKKDFFSVLNYYKYFFFIIPILFTSLNKKEVLKCLNIIGFSFGVFSLFCIAIYLGIMSWPESTIHNPKFLFNNMIAGAYGTLGTLILYYFFLTGTNNFRWINLLFSIISFIGLFINNSRSAQVAFLITIFILFILNFKFFMMNKKYFIFAFFLCSIVSIMIVNNENLLSRYSIAYDQVFSYDSKNNYFSSSGQRIKMYEIGINIFKENPFIGVGAGDFKDVFHTYVLDNNIKLQNLFTTLHSIYSEYLVKYGLVGFLLFFGALLFLFFSLFFNKRYKTIGIIILLPILVIFCFDSILDFKPFNNVFILLFTLLLILSTEKRIKS